jgi:hypothetical protein
MVLHQEMHVPFVEFVVRVAKYLTLSVKQFAALFNIIIKRTNHPREGTRVKLQNESKIHATILYTL